jgi:hypothetical protein
VGYARRDVSEPAPAPAPTEPEPPPPPGKRSLARRIGQKLLAVGIGLVIAFVLAECGLRLAGVGREVFQRPDGTYGQVLIPGAEGWFTTEGHAWVSVNADGFRDVRHPKTKPPDTLRIAVLGDSFVEALQVPQKDAFWSRLGDELAGCPNLGGRKVEMMSFGVSGYSTATELLLLRNRVWDWSPDVVLLAFLTGNDVADNHPALGAAAAPFYRLEGDQLVLDTSRAHGLGTGGRAMLWMIRHSRVLQLVNQVRVNLRVCGKVGACGEGLDLAQGELGLRNEIYLEPKDDTWREAWRVTEALLKAMRDEVAAHHARFFLVSLTNSIQVHPDPAVRAAFASRIGAADLFAPDGRLADLAARAGITSLALAPIFAARVAEDHRYYHGFPGPGLGTGHWNRDGHALAAARIAPWMCQNLAPPAVPAPGRRSSESRPSITTARPPSCATARSSPRRRRSASPG